MTAPTRAGRWAPTLLIASAFGLYFLVSRPAAAPAGWGDDYASAMRDAGATQRHVIIAFYSEGCPPCAAMDRTVLGTPEVRAALLGYVPIRLDVNRDREAAQRYQVVATPTFVVINEAGSVLVRREGYQSVEEFVAFLKDHTPLSATRPASIAPSASTAP
jgi:thiol:disulfide interchange protein